MRTRDFHGWCILNFQYGGLKILMSHFKDFHYRSRYDRHIASASHREMEEIIIIQSQSSNDPRTSLSADAPVDVSCSSDTSDEDAANLVCNY